MSARTKSKSLESGVVKVVLQILKDNAMGKTEFQDIAAGHLPELQLESIEIPQLESLQFYKPAVFELDDDIIRGYVRKAEMGLRSREWFESEQEIESEQEMDYIPMAIRDHKTDEQRQSGVRKLVQLGEILGKFDEGQISFVGQAGCGKTTLLKSMTRDIISGKYNNLKNIEMVHFVHLRDFQRKDLITTAELLFSDVTPRLNGEEMDAALQYAIENPKQALFVIDGLDTVLFCSVGYDRLKYRREKKQNMIEQTKVIVQGALKPQIDLAEGYLMYQLFGLMACLFVCCP